MLWGADPDKETKWEELVKSGNERNQILYHFHYFSTLFQHNVIRYIEV